MSCPSICPSGGRFVPKCVPPGTILSLGVSLGQFREGRVPRRSLVSPPRPFWALRVPRASLFPLAPVSPGVSPNFERVPRRVPPTSLTGDTSLRLGLLVYFLGAAFFRTLSLPSNNPGADVLDIVQSWGRQRRQSCGCCALRRYPWGLID